MSVTSLLTTANAFNAEEKPRLFSVGERKYKILIITRIPMSNNVLGSDGTALIWELVINGSVVSVLGGAPAGCLQCVGCFSQYLDEGSDTLYTISSDRTAK